jgi:N-acetylneuraminic acid mutarotase
MLHARAAHAIVATGDAIYAIGGTGAGSKPVLEVERFDGRAWREETTLPGNGLNAPAAVAIDGRIYVVGGFSTTTNVPTDRVLIYDLRRQSWSEAAPLPAPRGGHAVVVLDGKIHVLGGGNSQSTLADHSVYDPATNSWSARAPLPRAEGSPAVVVYRGRIYAIGGRSGPSDFGESYVYDAEHDAWDAGPPIEPRGTAGVTVYCGAIHIFGGESQAKASTLNSVIALDAERGAWRELPPMPTARNYSRAAVLGRDVYVIGGSPGYGNSHASSGSSIVERFSETCPQ